MSDLIEELGGYEKAKAILQAVGHEHDAMLLEYRRANNIYEVGDKVVPFSKNVTLFDNAVLEIAYFRDDLKLDFKAVRFTNGNDWNLAGLRHATPEEVQAGRRL